jgi:hypothetical protein
MQTVQLGNLGELKAMLEFNKLGFSVFTPISEGIDSFDFIAVKNNKLIRVEVKSSSQIINNGYIVAIKSTRHKYVRLFDPNSCDILGCYLYNIDELCFLDSKSISTTGTLTFRKEYSVGKHCRKKDLNQRLIKDHNDLRKLLIAMGIMKD